MLGEDETTVTYSYRYVVLMIVSRLYKPGTYEALLCLLIFHDGAVDERMR